LIGSPAFCEMQNAQPPQPCSQTESAERPETSRFRALFFAVQGAQKIYTKSEAVMNFCFQCHF